MSRQGTDGRVHARLSASESSRWINCPGSVSAIEALPDELKGRSSFDADRGTAAHSLAEMCLAKKKPARRFLGHKITAGKNVFEVDENMADAVQVYLDVIKELKRRYPDAEAHVEKQFHLDWVHPDCFGTNDFCLAVIFDTLVVVDYKHGYGEVDADQNTQLLYYAAGAAKEYEFNFDKVLLGIVQPRSQRGQQLGDDVDLIIENFYELSAAELEEWVDEVLRPAAYATEDPDAPLNPGSHCHWCLAASTCPAKTGAVFVQARADFEDEPYELPELTQEKREKAEAYAARLGHALKWVPFIKEWAKTVETQAYVAACNGLEIPERKLVEKEGDRAWAEEEAKLVKALKKAGASVDDMYVVPDPKLKSPAQMEKISKEVKKAVAGLVHRPKTGVALVHESDKRPAVGASLHTEFEPFDEESNS